MVTLTWHVCKHKVHVYKLTRGTSMGEIAQGSVSSRVCDLCRWAASGNSSYSDGIAGVYLRFQFTRMPGTVRVTRRRLRSLHIKGSK